VEGHDKKNITGALFRRHWQWDESPLAANAWHESSYMYVCIYLYLCHRSRERKTAAFIRLHVWLASSEISPLFVNCSGTAENEQRFSSTGELLDECSRRHVAGSNHYRCRPFARLRLTEQSRNVVKVRL